MPDVSLRPPTHTDGHDHVNNSQVIPRPHVARHGVPCLLRMNSLLPTECQGWRCCYPMFQKKKLRPKEGQALELGHSQKGGGESAVSPSTELPLSDQACLPLMLQG